MQWKGGGGGCLPPPGRLVYAQPLSMPRQQVPGSMAFVTNRNRPKPLWQPPPTAYLSASGAASEVPSLLLHPCRALPPVIPVAFAYVVGIGRVSGLCTVLWPGHEGALVTRRGPTPAGVPAGRAPEGLSGSARGGGGVHGLGLAMWALRGRAASACKACFSPSLCVFHPIWVLGGLGGGGLPRGLGHNLLMQFSSLGSSRMVVLLPSSRCLAEGNRIWTGKFLAQQTCTELCHCILPTEAIFQGVSVSALGMHSLEEMTAII